MKANELLDWDEEELEPETEAEVFGQLLRAIANNEGAGCLYVQCSRGQEESVIERLRERFARVSVLELVRDSVSIYPEAMGLLAQDNFDVLVVRGLDQALLGYEDAKRALGWDDAALHNYDLRDVPQILHHLNQIRECWHERLLRPVVFVVPPFVVRYLILRCPDFYDWRVGTFVLPLEESEQQQLEDWARWGDHSKYLQLSSEERVQKVSELHDLIEISINSIENRAYFLKEQGLLFASNQDMELALSCFKRSLIFKPNDYEVWHKHGYTLHLLMRSEDALASYDKALQLSPNYYIAWSDRGDILRDLGQTEEAIKNHYKAIKINPNCQLTWSNLGLALEELKFYKEAEEAYRKALAIEERTFDYTNLGNVLRKQGCYHKALASYDKALEIDSNYHLAWSGHGLTLRSLERYEAAEISYRKALAIEERAFDYTNLGNVLKKQKCYHKALASYDKALEIDSNYYLAWSLRGFVLEDLKRDREAEASYRQALAIEENATDYTNLSDVLRSQKRYDEALASCDKALEIDPNYLLAWSWRGFVLEDLKRYEEAEASYRQALAIEEQAFDYTNLGDLFRSQKCYDEALSSYHKALELEPDYLHAHYSISLTYTHFIEPPNYTAARAAFQACLEYDKNDPEAYYGFACIDSLQHHLDSALKHLQHVFELNSSYRDRACKDKDFDSIRHDPRFQALINPDQ